MLNILKRKNIRKEDYTFLNSIASRLIDKYPYLVSQISKDFILDKKDNEFESKGTYTLILNAKLESKYINRKLPQFFIIKDIFIWNKIKNKKEPIELDVMQGMLPPVLVSSFVFIIASKKSSFFLYIHLIS